MQINLNENVAKQLEERVNASDEFSTVEEYVNYVLDEVLKQTATAETATQPEDAGDDKFTEAQEEQVKKRLEDLGYLD